MNRCTCIADPSITCIVHPKRDVLTSETLAAQIDGSEYGEDRVSRYRGAAKAAGLVIVSGQSDDLMEFDGAISDELGAYDGTTAYLTERGLVTNDCENDGCPHFERAKKAARTIDAIWGEGGASWTFRTDIPHSTFKVMEDGDIYCVGIVFRLADAAPATQDTTNGDAAAPKPAAETGTTGADAVRVPFKVTSDWTDGSEYVFEARVENWTQYADVPGIEGVHIAIVASPAQDAAHGGRDDG